MGENEQHRDLLRNRKVPDDACGNEINGRADVIVAVVAVVVVATAVIVVITGITSRRWKC